MTTEPVLPQQPRWRRWALGILVAVLFVASVVAVLAYTENRNRAELARRVTCAPGVTKVRGTEECVGITDGSYRFQLGAPDQQPHLDRVLGLIATANQAVRDSRAPWVTVAYLLPMPWNGQGSMPPDSVVHQLYGAYAAQIEANEGNNGADTPKVRLLVANTGHDGVAWSSVTSAMVERRRADRIAVVAGLGQSLKATESTAERFSAAGLPMVGATITADNLNGDRYPHLYRVAPTNDDEVAVGLRFLRQLPTYAGDRTSAAFLVASGNPADSYVVELQRAFGVAFQNNFATRTYDPDALGYTQLLQRSAEDICNRDTPATVYFAGRSKELRIFLEQLGKRCDPRQRVTILSGDDASGLVGQADRALTAALEGKAIELYYTGLAHPGQWGPVKPEHPLGRLVEHLRNKTDNAAPDLTDGGAIMGYDAVSVSMSAVRGIGPSERDLQNLGSLANGFQQINDGTPFCGASGPIALETNRREARGNTVNKPIPVIQVTPAGAGAFKALRYPVEPPAKGTPVKPGQAHPGWAGRCGTPR